MTKKEKIYKKEQIQVQRDILNYLDTHHPCKKCKGFVSDGAIICMHCERHDP